MVRGVGESVQQQLLLPAAAAGTQGEEERGRQRGGQVRGRPRPAEGRLQQRLVAKRRREAMATRGRRKGEVEAHRRGKRTSRRGPPLAA